MTDRMTDQMIRGTLAAVFALAMVSAACTPAGDPTHSRTTRPLIP
jgi:hypothetical protein